tara:strand:- start:8530 stop:8772 length:243 start_codon:yes stop_codon:yes gene_type:complete
MKDKISSWIDYLDNLNFVSSILALAIISAVLFFICVCFYFSFLEKEAANRGIVEGIVVFMVSLVALPILAVTSIFYEVKE